MRTRREWLQKVGVALGSMAIASCAREPEVPLGLLAWNRAGFGPRPGQLEGFSFEKFLEEQLHPDDIADDQLDERLRQMEFETQNKSYQALWNDHYLAQDDAETDEDWDWVGLPHYETVQATLLRAVYSRRQLKEVMTDFWHNHFSVYGLHDDVSPLLTAYDRDAIRPHVLGNFGNLLRAVAGHPVMLLYLGNSSNEVSGPNENFARELLELHTLGARSYQGSRDPRKVELGSDATAKAYVDNDVYEVARCFTGWTLDESDSDDVTGGTGRFQMSSESHDRFNKLVLGRYLPSDQGVAADCETVLEMLAAHPATAQHIAWKLCRRLVSDQPPSHLVARAAELFHRCRQDKDQIRQVVALILRSQEFRQSWGGKTKRPFEFAVSLVRALELDFQADDDFIEAFDAMGQPLFGRPTPDGYPDLASTWQHTNSILFRWRLVQLLTQSAPLDGSRTLKDWSGRLLGRPSDQLHLLAGLNNRRDQVALLAMGPEFQMR